MKKQDDYYIWVFWTGVSGIFVIASIYAVIWDLTQTGWTSPKNQFTWLVLHSILGVAMFVLLCRSVRNLSHAKKGECY